LAGNRLLAQVRTWIATQRYGNFGLAAGERDINQLPEFPGLRRPPGLRPLPRPGDFSGPRRLAATNRTGSARPAPLDAHPASRRVTAGI